MLKRLGRWWRKKQREMDMEILWPQCVHVALKRYDAEGHMVLAKASFALHVFSDPAWKKDFTHDEIREFVDNLKPGDKKAP